MPLPDLDWPALDRLRDGFLHGAAAQGPYWQTDSALASYDATYGERIAWKWDAALRELTRRHWRPTPGTRLLDWGCGSGIAGRRVLATLGSETFAGLDVWDHAPLARDFAARRARDAFPTLTVGTVPVEPAPADLHARPTTLVLSHVLNELSPAQRDALLDVIASATHVLWIEPGTHAISRDLATLRDRIVATGRHRIVAPCTHAVSCPLFAAGRERDWCHAFAEPPVGVQNNPDWVRFAQRAGVDLRSQAYSWLVLDRADTPPTAPLPEGAARLLGRPEVFKPYARVLACEASGLHDLELSKRVAPDLVKRLDKRPPVPLYAFTHDTHRIAAAKPLVD